MSLEVKRKDRETVQSLVYRFKKGMEQSGILIRAKKTRFHGRPRSNLNKKRAALRKIELEKEFAKLKKLGRA